MLLFIKSLNSFSKLLLLIKVDNSFNEFEIESFSFFSFSINLFIDVINVFMYFSLILINWLNDSFDEEINLSIEKL